MQTRDRHRWAWDDSLILSPIFRRELSYTYLSVTLSHFMLHLLIFNPRSDSLSIPTVINNIISKLSQYAPQGGVNGVSATRPEWTTGAGRMVDEIERHRKDRSDERQKGRTVSLHPVSPFNLIRSYPFFIPTVKRSDMNRAKWGKWVSEDRPFLLRYGLHRYAHHWLKETGSERREQKDRRTRGKGDIIDHESDEV